MTDLRVSFDGDENKALLEELTWQYSGDEEPEISKDELVEKLYEWGTMYK